MSDKTELRMNLAAIKRVDPYAKDIVDSSAHVAFYTFNSDENEWEKTDVEGVFFIYSRNAEPFHSIFINNRLNTNSFVEPINGQLELQSQSPFLLYRNERSRIRGFWFYNSSECDRIGELVGRLIKNCETKLKENHDVIMSNPVVNNNVNIFTMLSKAQEDFNNSQHMPVNNFKSGENRNSANNIIVGPPTNPTEVASQSVMNFFAAAKPAAASEVPLFQRLLSNPVSLEQIEKQQRASTPQDDKPNTTASGGGSVGGGSVGNCGLENGVSFIRIQSPKPTQDLSTSPLAKFFGTTNPIGNTKNLMPSDIEPQQQQKPLQQLLKKDANVYINSPQNLNNTLQTTTTTTAAASKPALMPPTMFISSTSGNSDKEKKVSVCSKDSQKPNSTTFAKFEPLTETQLLQAMMHLFQNDPEFIKKLHEAYLKSFTEMVTV